MRIQIRRRFGGISDTLDKVTPKSAVFALLVLCLSAPLPAQLLPQFNCVLSTVTPTNVRAEGVTEPLNDIVLTCTGGTPTANGVPVATVNFQLFLNTNVSISNRLDASGFVDAFMIVDEPHSVTNPTRPLLACTGDCSINGSGTGTTTYDGTPGRPNVFPAAIVNGLTNSLSWLSIPLDPPGVGGLRTIRITNVRANAFLMSGYSGNQIIANLTVNGGQQVTISQPDVLLSFAQPGLRSSFATVANLSLCSPANPSIAADPSQPLDTGGQNGVQFSARLSEGFANAFVAKNDAQKIADAPSSGVFPAAAYPVDVNQNIPGFVYNTETGFFNFALDPAPFPTNPAISFTCLLYTSDAADE